jgi:rubrerythrin
MSRTGTFDRKKTARELSISLETGSYDRFQILQGRADDEKSQEIFNVLAAEEKRHLGLLTELFEKHL